MNPEPLHLLVVDDEESHVEAIRRVFAPASPAVHIATVATLGEYRERVAAHPPDIALVDLNLPDGRAVEILTQPLADAPFPIVVMTAFGDQRIVVEVMKAGALDYIVKSPEAFATLPRTVEGALREWKLLKEKRQSEAELTVTNAALKAEIAARQRLKDEQLRLLDDAERARKVMLGALEDQLRTKATLRAREARYAAMVHAIGDAIVSADSEGDIVGWNPGAALMFGYAESEILGQPLTRLMPARHQENHTAGMARVTAGGERHVIGKIVEMTGRRKDGGEFPLNLSLSEWRADEQTFFTAVIRDITEAKRAEAELRKLSRIVEQAPLSIVITDLASMIEYANPAACAVSGYAPAEVLGRNPRMFKSGNTLPEVYREMWETLNRGEVWSGEFNNKKKNGELYAELAVIAPVTGDAGVITHYVALKQDITDEKAKETALRESEQRFRELFDQVSDAILVVEADTGRIIQANQVACATYGHTVAGLLAMCIADITAEAEQNLEGQEAAQRGLDKVIKVPHRLHRKSDGTLFPVEINVRTFQRAGQMMLVEVIRDITEQVKAREQLERFNVELEEKVTLRTEELALRNIEIEALLQSVPDLVMRVRSDGTVLSFQPAKGETPLAIAAKKNDRARRPAHLFEPLVKAALPLGSRALKENTAVAGEAEIALGGDPLATELRVAPIGSGEFVVFARDITERKRLEAVMVTMLAKERQVSEMKSRFISVTSHEFRTPMAAAMASADLLHNHLDRLSPAKREELFTRISASLHRLTQMLDEVLLLNRIDANRVEVRLGPVELRDCTHTVVEEIRVGDRDAHRFELLATGDTARFVTDTDLLHHILSNLLSNAVRYSPAGTAVTTRIVAEAGRVLVMVEDQGIGVPEADRERIFESFERGSNVGTIKGTGLGLDIVKRMTKLLGGTITVEAPAGGGSRFILSLPRIENPSAASP